MNALELKIPPVLVLLIAGVLMWWAAVLAPGLHFAFPGMSIVASSLIGLGVACGVLGVISFRRARTTVHPMKPEEASSLVTTGIYEYSRNPMYLGMLLVLAGWAVYLSSAPAYLGLPLFVAYMTRFQIRPEERALAAHFGEAFNAYTRKVRRWL